MNAFKQQIYKDHENNWFNINEFGRICLWSPYPFDTTIELPIAEDARQENQKYEAQGVNSDMKIIYCSDIDLIPHPKVYDVIKLDNDERLWDITNIKNPATFLIITLERKVA